MSGTVDTGGVTPELVVLLSPDGEPVGAADKATVHTADTPLHLAFSSYLFGPDGRLLLTQRALSKTAWPGVWTNSCCGHPAPGEAPEDAVRRRIGEELRLAVTDLRLVLPEFAYRAVDASGVVENEVCPVWFGRVDGDPDPDPAEVAAWRWVDWPVADRTGLSPWAVLQLEALGAA